LFPSFKDLYAFFFCPVLLGSAKVAVNFKVPNFFSFFL
jgi:hypothetical protein